MEVEGELYVCVVSVGPHVNVLFPMVVVYGVMHDSLLTQMLGHQGSMVPGMVPGNPQQPPPEKRSLM